jgi:hypothetical protein
MERGRRPLAQLWYTGRSATHRNGISRSEWPAFGRLVLRAAVHKPFPRDCDKHVCRLFVVSRSPSHVPPPSLSTLLFPSVLLISGRASSTAVAAVPTARAPLGTTSAREASPMTERHARAYCPSPMHRARVQLWHLFSLRGGSRHLAGDEKTTLAVGTTRAPRRLLTAATGGE